MKLLRVFTINDILTNHGNFSSFRHVSTKFQPGLMNQAQFNDYEFGTVGIKLVLDKATVVIPYSNMKHYEIFEEPEAPKPPKLNKKEST